jgi:hypothetical protein
MRFDGRLCGLVVGGFLAACAHSKADKIQTVYDGAKCVGTPRNAVMTLPSPLDEWGTIVCTEYGHIISNREGWIWSYPGTYARVFIPSQMVKDNPKPLGNQSYFIRIEMRKVEGQECETAYNAFNKGFAKEPVPPVGYRLDLTSNSGRALLLYFFRSGKNGVWGVWCEEECKPVSRFMVLDMTKKSPAVN